MTSTHKSQADRILDALKAGRWLSALDALDDFGCFRLAARVHELRRAGHDIRRVNVQKYNDGKSHAEYYLAPTVLAYRDGVIAIELDQMRQPIT